MAERVAEIEQRAPPASRSSWATIGALARQERRSPHAGSRRRSRSRASFLPASQEFRIVDQPVFGDFRVAGAKFTLGQRVENIGVGQHQRG